MRRSRSHFGSGRTTLAAVGGEQVDVDDLLVRDLLGHQVRLLLGEGHPRLVQRLDQLVTDGSLGRGDSETAIYIVSGNPVFVFLDTEGDEPVETRVETSPGDYVFVPPWVPHREENPDPEYEAVVVIARTSQEAIVVNLEGLDWSEVRLKR